MRSLKELYYSNLCDAAAVRWGPPAVNHEASASSSVSSDITRFRPACFAM